MHDSLGLFASSRAIRPQGSFPEIPVSANPSPPADRPSRFQPFIGWLRDCARVVVSECRQTAIATWHQAMRLSDFVRGLWTRWRLRRAVHLAERPLGEASYRACIGDEAVRTRIAKLDEQIQEALSSRKPAAVLRKQRSEEILALAATIEQENPYQSEVMDEILKLRSTRQAFEAQNGRVRHMRENLFPIGRTDRLRVASGFAAATCFLILGAVWARHSRDAAGAQSSHSDSYAAQSKPVSDTPKDTNPYTGATPRPDPKYAFDKNYAGHSVLPPQTGTDAASRESSQIPSPVQADEPPPRTYTEAVRRANSTGFEDLTDDSTYGELNRKIVAVTEGALDRRSLRAKIGTVNSFAAKAKLNQQTTLRMFEQLLFDPGAGKKDAAAALDALASKLSLMVANEEVAKDPPKKPKAVVEYVRKLAGPELLGQISVRDYLRANPKAQLNKELSERWRGIEVYDGPLTFDQHMFVDGRLAFFQFSAMRGSRANLDKFHQDFMAKLGPSDSNGLVTDQRRKEGVIYQNAWWIYECDVKLVYTAMTVELAGGQGVEHIQLFSLSRIMMDNELEKRVK